MTAGLNPVVLPINSVTRPPFYFLQAYRTRWLEQLNWYGGILGFGPETQDMTVAEAKAHLAECHHRCRGLLQSGDRYLDAIQLFLALGSTKDELVADVASSQRHADLANVHVEAPGLDLLVASTANGQGAAL